MYRKLIGACVGLAMMGMAGTAAHALPIIPAGETYVLEFDYSGSSLLPPNLFEFDPIFINTTVSPNDVTVLLFEDVNTLLASSTFTIGSPIGSTAGITWQVTLNGTTDLLDGIGLVGILPIDGDVELSVFAAIGRPKNLLLRTGVGFENHPIDNSNFQPLSIPEPSTLALFATGLAMFGFIGWRRRKRVQVKAA